MTAAEFVNGTPCADCVRPMLSQPTWKRKPERRPGHVRHNGGELCTGCYGAARRVGTLPNPAPKRLVRRGTTNRNVRGNTVDRARRRAWLVETFRANVDTHPMLAHAEMYRGVPLGQGTPACRCYRCGVLLTVDTVTVDRIIPGVKGGTYRRSNIRPSCAACNSETGGALAGSGAR